MDCDRLSRKQRALPPVPTCAPGAAYGNRLGARHRILPGGPAGRGAADEASSYTVSYG